LNRLDQVVVEVERVVSRGLWRQISGLGLRLLAPFISRSPRGERTSFESAPGSGCAISRHSHSGPGRGSPPLASALDGPRSRWCASRSACFICIRASVNSCGIVASGDRAHYIRPSENSPTTHSLALSAPRRFRLSPPRIVRRLRGATLGVPAEGDSAVQSATSARLRSGPRRKTRHPGCNRSPRVRLHLEPGHHRRHRLRCEGRNAELK
jgi:hypothetical protein